MGVVLLYSTGAAYQLGSFKVGPSTTKFPGSGTATIPVKAKDPNTIIKPVALAVIVLYHTVQPLPVHVTHERAFVSQIEDRSLFDKRISGAGTVYL